MMAAVSAAMRQVARLAANRHHIEIRLAAMSDVYALAACLRAGDRAEILAMNKEPRRMLREWYRASLGRPITALIDGHVAAMWGLGGDILSDTGIPWLMTGTPCDQVPISVARIAREQLEQMFEIRPELENWVMASYKGAVALLQTMGFLIDEPVPQERTGVKFRRFHLTREEYELRRQQRKIMRPGAKFSPFIIYAAGRSRTAWLSAFLTYGKCRCHHELSVKLSNMDDLVSLFAETGMGSAETAMGSKWRQIQRHLPAIKSVVIRRPLDEILASFMRMAPALDQEQARATVAAEIAHLNEISAHPGVLTVDFENLAHADVCAAIFEYCLPYKFDMEWWIAMDGRNIQVKA